jgi:hypothetical protein
LRGDAYLPSQFQKFAMQCVVLLRGLVSQFLDPKAQLPLPPYRKDGENRSG